MTDKLTKVACLTCPHFVPVNRTVPSGEANYRASADGRCTLNPEWKTVQAGHYCGQHPLFGKPLVEESTDVAA